MKLKNLLIIAFALCLLLSACGQTTPAPTAEPTPEASPESAPADIPQDNLGFSVGKTMPDFSITTYDGETYSLYETLSEKEFVLINVWATWCGPCGMEFPYMEEAYQLYKDKVEIFALSCEPGDTDEVLADYASKMGLSFPVAQDSPGVASAFMVFSIPTTIIIDHSGTIRSIELGAKTSTEAFTKLFDSYLAPSAEYCVRFTDEQGNAVPGVMLQVCDESLCQVFTSDEKGECSFALPPYAYELHILSLPKGYGIDSEAPTTAPAEGGEVHFGLIGK